MPFLNIIVLKFLMLVVNVEVKYIQQVAVAHFWGNPSVSVWIYFVF